MSLTFCPLFSGSSGNALYVCAGHTRILVDAGVAGRPLVEALAAIGATPDGLSGILITHEHSDHIKGAGVLSRKYNIPVYANALTWEAMESKLGDVALKNRRVFDTGADFYIQDVGIQPFAIPHDAADPVGYALHYKGHKVATATDLGHISPSWMAALRGAELLMLEANHDPQMLEMGSYPAYLKQRIRGRKGHLSNADSGKALCKLVAEGVRHCILGHLSQENNLPELAYQTVADALGDQGIRVGQDISLELAMRHGPGSVYTIA